MLPSRMREIAPRAPAIGIAAIILILAIAHTLQPPHEAQRDPAAEFRLIGPQGDTAVVRLPELAKLPPLDLDAACVALRAHNAEARAMRQSWPGDVRDGFAKAVVYDGAEAGCSSPAARNYEFYDALGDALNTGSFA